MSSTPGLLGATRLACELEIGSTPGSRAGAAYSGTRAACIPAGVQYGVPYNVGALGRCAVSEKADRDDSRDDRSWLDALTKKEEQKLIARLRQRYQIGRASWRERE